MKQESNYHYHQAISLTFEQKAMLEDICQKTKMSKSEVVQELIKKAYSDKKTRDIIQWNFASNLETKRQLRIMSNASTKKDEPTHHREGSTAVSLNNRDHDNTEEVSDEEVDAALASLDEPEESLDDMLKELYKDKHDNKERELDLQKNAQKFANLTCQILSAEQLNAVAYENWTLWTIGELIKIADENIRRNKK